MTRHVSVRHRGDNAKDDFVSWLLAAFLVAVPMNFIWEMAQSALYAPMGSEWRSAWLCFRASIGDGIIIAYLLAGGTLLFGRRFWTGRRGVVAYCYLMVTGIVVATAIDWFALEHGRWAYRPTMPLVPGTGIGVVPVLQMAVLPILTMRLVGALKVLKNER